VTAYEIRLSGCDDSTTFEMDLTDAEAGVAARTAERSRATSTYDCEPRMTIQKAQEVTE